MLIGVPPRPGSDTELTVILDFLHRSAGIQREATRALAEQE
ncbi:hypothetical protein ACIP3A_33665 [Streptomyces tricolor]